MRAETRYKTTYQQSEATKKLEHLIYEKKGHVAYVTINRPERLNAYHPSRLQGLNAVGKAMPRPRNLHPGAEAGKGGACERDGGVRFFTQYRPKGDQVPEGCRRIALSGWGGAGDPPVPRVE